MAEWRLTGARPRGHDHRMSISRPCERWRSIFSTWRLPHYLLAGDPITRFRFVESWPRTRLKDVAIAARGLSPGPHLIYHNGDGMFGENAIARSDWRFGLTFKQSEPKSEAQFWSAFLQQTLGETTRSNKK